jgi:DNA-binding response OmpR family regulator
MIRIKGLKKIAKERILKKNIILVEDNLYFAETVIEVIEESTEFNVVHFENPRPALEFIKLNRRTVAGVISDLMMSGMDGVDFVSELRSSDYGKDLSVFFLSGMDSGILWDLLLPYNVSGFLEKPVDFNHLLLMIKKNFSSHDYSDAA